MDRCKAPLKRASARDLTQDSQQSSHVLSMQNTSSNQYENLNSQYEIQSTSISHPVITGTCQKQTNEFSAMIDMAHTQTFRTNFPWV